jgi:hypothetical protein
MSFAISAATAADPFLASGKILTGILSKASIKLISVIDSGWFA